MMRFAKIEKTEARVAVGALALVSLLGITGEHRAQAGRKALSEDAAATFAAFNGPECGNRAGAKRRPRGASKDASVRC